MFKAATLLLTLLVGIAIGITWASNQTLISREEAKESVENCTMYFAEKAPTSIGVEAGVAMCRQAEY